MELRRRTGVRLSDIGPMRAAPREMLLELGPQDRRSGWPLEMVLQALLRCWRVREVASSYLRRAGRSKVTATERDGACRRRHGQGAPLSALLVIARAPRPGHSKTRLCPPCTLEQAAGLAEAALKDTLEAVGARWLRGHSSKKRGPRWTADGWLLDAEAPSLSIGMDTPQVTPRLLREALGLLESPGVDSMLGPATHGGYWAIGLRDADPPAFDGVPMSTARTAEAQLAQLQVLSLTTELLPVMRDVDHFEDARAVSAECAGSRFRPEFDHVLRSLGRRQRALSG